MRRDHRYRTKPEKSGVGFISLIPVVEVISVVIAATEIRSEKSQNIVTVIGRNRQGSAESGPITAAMEILGPVGPIYGPTGPNISIVTVLSSNGARPGPLLLLCTFSLRI